MDMPMNENFNKGSSLATQIYQRLRRAIITIELKPGQNLSEQDLASKMDVSRQPIREALIRLRESGLVKILPQRGTYVVGISKTAMLDAHFIRKALETALILDVIGKTGPEFEQRMKDILDKQAAAAVDDNWAEFVSWDDAFHKAFAEFGGKEHTWQVIESRKAHYERVRYLSYCGRPHIDLMIEQHKKILEGVLAGDREKTEKAVHEHLSHILKAMPEIFKEHSELFDQED
jgi:DNA-binding GntR family transcriptional regulator